METARMALAPSRDLVGVPSSEIILWSSARWSAASRLTMDLAISVLALATALSTPFPRYFDLSPSRNSRASCSPVEAPEGTAARPSAPPARRTSASTVGLPRESMTWRAWTLAILVDMLVWSPRTRCESMILQKIARESQRHGEMNEDLKSMVEQFALSRFGFLDEGYLANDDDDAGFGDVEAAFVGFEVIANLGALGKADVTVDDGATDARMAADVHVIIDDGRGNLRVAVDAHVVADHRWLYVAAGNNRATGNDGIERHAHALRIGEDKLCRGVLVLPGAQRPGTVVQVEDRRHADQIHVGVVVGVQRAHVAPIQSIFAVFIDEVVGKDAMLRNNARKDVLAKVVVRLGILGIGQQDGDHQLSVEDVDAHGGVAMPGMVRGLFWLRGLFLEADNAPVLVDFDDPKLPRRLFDRNLNGGDGDLRSGVKVLLKHLRVVHLVNMITGKDEDELRTLAADRVDVLVNRVGRALIPLLRDAHLRRWGFSIISAAGPGRPACAAVAGASDSGLRAL